MLELLKSKIFDSAKSIVPITVVVLIVSLSPVFSLYKSETIVFIISTIGLIIAMALFNFGTSLSMIPMGEYVGAGLIKTRNAFILISVTFALGFFVTIAEPDIMLLADEVRDVFDSTMLILLIGVGVGIFMIIAVMKMVSHKQLVHLILVLYMSLFSIALLLFEQEKYSFLPLAFDSGGVSTGPIIVPFIMSFGVGISSTIGGRDSNENSFGMVSLSSVGPIMILLLLSLFSSGKFDYKYSQALIADVIEKDLAIEIIKDVYLTNIISVAKAIGMILVFLVILQITLLKLPKSKFIEMLIGMTLTYIGLTLFLSTVQLGFYPIGESIGIQLADDKIWLIAIFGLIIGMTVVFAEPSIAVLITQVEEITAGAVKKKSMLIALSIGVGIALALSLVRVMLKFSLVYYLVPGYVITLILSIFVPPIYTSIAFDSGGVASGPMAASFIVPMVIGFCSALHGSQDILDYAFGTVAMISMAPLITIQFLGFKAVFIKFIKDRIMLGRMLDADDDQVVYFDREY